MKKVFLAVGLVAAVAFTSCKDNASDKVKGENVEMAATRDADATVFPTMEFEESAYDFGNIARGTAVEHVFKFKNTGKAPLVIVDATSTCGCTVPSYPKEPIQPGETGELLVKYNGSGLNAVTKIVTVKSNTEKGSETVKITAFVQSAEGPAVNG
ncbi:MULTISPECIES: DUF1573 domain-containing protein [Leeuwenhoekiella]|uniref:DUF1573 domain-containing protein n=1 Tax=Leeuwenhoekiella palythoae TaxID=573501 RepID=A0A1M5XWP1_9FLAO|nr:MULTISPECIES: DUF1573 domain-containing protein [Leeuwenhoekiella]MAS18855.1 DUF1573 domain-containing protein [Leeuwenhoekiella sp.]MEE3225811.1 DUF1573 domain-containing protein [Bacteroidota bacterium]MBH11722.1 DUF1573 domain-containing protein [Leeuwenhoekiella sp.]MEE3244213.1 DUF1573 domain-containing protein [Bacteroidota bacterium]RXG30312.1 putative protein DUF1573 [Leeuwenhoekiella palythoae]|tara:strand:+ start:138 stop:602 length:465 start_codon:yes stop_codon:yes gene_type:complete